MNVSIIGTNGLLSSCLGRFCNEQNFNLDIYGRTVPKNHAYTSFFKVDLTIDELNYAQLVKSDVIIYAAGAGIQSHLKEEANYIYHLNVAVPIKIFNSLKKLNYQGVLIGFGSYFEIGENAENKSFDEIEILKSQLHVPNDYTISKRTLNRFLSSVESPFTNYHFILPTIYGETESQNRLIPYTLKSIKTNTELSFTSGDQIRQYIYIDDVINIIFHTIQLRLPSAIYNIGSVEELSVKELVVMLFMLMNKEVPPNVFGKAERTDVGMMILKLNGDKLRKNISYIPKTKIADVYAKYRFE